MGRLTDVIVAGLHEAEAVCVDGARSGKWPCLQNTGLDHLMLGALALAWNDRAQAENLDSLSLIAAMAADEGPFLLHLPNDFRDRLAAVTSADVPALARAWAQEEIAQDGDWTAGDLEPLLNAIRELAALAVARQESLLLWICI
ncbi:MAG: hypothetical protein FWD68_21050 [Alphaproteobacteria bacterium]|nr:hypothetical protein [Alphaproteobacteria bacterium]